MRITKRKTPPKRGLKGCRLSGERGYPRARRGLDFRAPERGCESLESGSDLKTVCIALPPCVQRAAGWTCNFKDDAVLPKCVLLSNVNGQVGSDDHGSPLHRIPHMPAHNTAVSKVRVCQIRLAAGRREHEIEHA